MNSSDQENFDAGSVYASMNFPDPTRSSTGAWLLPNNLEANIQNFRSSHHTEAQAWELAGAIWDEDFHSRTTFTDVVMFMFDPVKTTIEIVDDGYNFKGS